MPLVICAAKLNLDLWYDEAYTIQVFVSRRWATIVTDYSAPNNHVLYSFLLRPFYLASDSNFMLRLPSFVATAGTLALVFRLAQRTAGLVGAVLATAFLGLTEMFLVHTMQVRGYGLSMLLTVWLANLAILPPLSRFGEGAGGGGTWRRLASIAVAGAALLYVMPTNVLLFVPLGAIAVLAVAIHDKARLVKEIAAWSAACLLAGVLYWPILDQVRGVGNLGMKPSLATATTFMEQFFFDAFHDWVALLPFAGVGLAAWLVRAARRRSWQDVELAAGALAILIGPFALVLLLPGVPYLRNFCPMLPLVAIVMGGLLVECGTLAGRIRLAWSSPPKVALAGLTLLCVVALPWIATYPMRLTELRNRQWAQDGYYNYYAANFHPAELMRSLRQRLPDNEDYLICFAEADYFPLVHYADQAGLPLARTVRGSGSARVYLVLPAVADYPAVAGRCGFPEKVLRAIPFLEDFGYFRLYRSNGPLPLPSPPPIAQESDIR